MTDVLVLYPGPPRLRQPLVHAHRSLLASLGVRLVLADHAVEPSDRECFADAIELPPPHRVAEGWEVLRRELSRRRLHAVIAQSEDAVLLGALAARELSVPGVAPEAAFATVSKVHTRRALHTRGVGQPRFALGSSTQDVLSFASEAGWPVVLKAAASVCSRLVTLVARPEEAQEAVIRLLAALPRSEYVARIGGFARATGIDPQFEPTREFLIEEFERGAPVETDGVLWGTRPISFGVIEQVLTPPPRFYLEGYLLPSDRPAQERAAIEDESAAALRAVGLSNTGYSIEMRFDGTRARVIEVNGRLGWDEGFGELFATLHGVEPAVLALQVALGLEPRLAPTGVEHAALAYLSCFEDAIVCRVPDEAELRQARALVKRVEIIKPVGSRMYAPPHHAVEPHLAYALATDPHSSRAAHARAKAAIPSRTISTRPCASGDTAE